MLIHSPRRQLYTRYIITATCDSYIIFKCCAYQRVNNKICENLKVYKCASSEILQQLLFSRWQIRFSRRTRTSANSALDVRTRLIYIYTIHCVAHVSRVTWHQLPSYIHQNKIRESLCVLVSKIELVTRSLKNVCIYIVKIWSCYAINVYTLLERYLADDSREFISLQLMNLIR